MQNRDFRAGAHVLVRTANEIIATLDTAGALDGVVFMPEMLESCGKPFRVLRRVEKTCVDGYPLRRFPGNDVVILDGPRCDGSSHDGCAHGCRIFWKEAWLRPNDAGGTTTHDATAGTDVLRSRLKVKIDAERYFCQSTELSRATTAFPGKQVVWRLRIALREIRAGDLSVREVARMFTLWLREKLWRAKVGDTWLRGPNVRTPSLSLNLRPGEVVRVKSLPQIVTTLDGNRRNRGMGICHEMARCCGREAEVRYRVARLINETTGVMQEMSDTVVLRIRDDKKLAEECLCFDEPGDCPRGELMYWREIWLERISSAREGDSE